MIDILDEHMNSVCFVRRVQQKKAAMINESFCGDGLNGGGIKARYPLETTSSWESNSVFGISLIISTQNNFTVAIIGTADGRLLKVTIVSIS